MNSKITRKITLAFVVLATAATVLAEQTDYAWQVYGESLSGLFTDANRWDRGTVPGAGYPDLSNVNQTGVFAADGTAYTVSFPEGVYTSMAAIKGTVAATDGSSIRFLGKGATWELPAVEGNWPAEVFSLSSEGGLANMLRLFGENDGYESRRVGSLSDFDMTVARIGSTNLLDISGGTYELTTDRVSLFRSVTAGTSTSVVRFRDNASLDCTGLFDIGYSSPTNIVVFSGGTHWMRGNVHFPARSGKPVGDDKTPSHQILLATDGASVKFGSGAASAMSFGALYTAGKSVELIAEKNAEVTINSTLNTEGRGYQDITVRSDATVVAPYHFNYCYYNAVTGTIRVADGGVFKGGASYTVTLGGSNKNWTNCRTTIDVRDGGTVWFPGKVKVYFSDICLGAGACMKLEKNIEGPNFGLGRANLYADGAKIEILNTALNDPVISMLDTFEIGTKGLTFDLGTRARTIDQDISGAGTMTVTGTGTLTLSSGRAVKAGMSLASGATLKADGVAFGNLTLNGILDRNPMADPITVNGALDTAGCSFKFSSPLTAGPYTVFVCTMPQSDAAKGEWEVFSNVVQGLDPNKYYSFRCEEESGKTYFRIYVSDELPALAGNVTWKGPGADWTSPANWEGVTQAPGTTNRAVFAGAAPASITVAEDVRIAAMKFDSDATSYTVAGSTIKIEPNAGNEVVVAAGDHTLGTPLKMAAATTFDIAAKSSLELSGTLTGGGIVKRGAGRLDVTGSGSRVFYPFSIYGGLLRFADIAAIGSPGSGSGAFSDGTFEVGAGAAGRIAGTLDINSAKSDSNAVIFKNESNLAMPMPTLTRGAVMKRGAGSLVFETASTANVSWMPTEHPAKNQASEASLRELVFDNEYGAVPDGKYYALNIFEGDLTFKGTGSTQTKIETNPGYKLSVGTPTGGVTSKSAEPSMTLDHVYLYPLNGSVRLGCGVLAESDCPMASHFVMTNDAKATLIYLTTASGTTKPGYSANVSIFGSHAEFVNLGLNDSGRSDVTNHFRVVDSELVVDANPEPNGSFDMELDNTYYHRQKGDKILVIRYYSGFDTDLHGRISLKNNSSIWCNEIRHNSTQAMYVQQPFFLEFDDSQLYLGGNGATFNTSNLDVRVMAKAGGFRMAPEAGNTWDYHTQVTGPGGLIKEGAGTLFVDRFFRYGKYVTEDTCTIACDGINEVRAGTLSIARGAAKEGMPFAVFSGALLTLNGGTLDASTVSGAGTVADGTLVSPTLRVAYDDRQGATIAPMLDLANGLILSGRVTVDFGRTESNPMPEKFSGLVVVRWTGSQPPDVSKWRCAGTGLERHRYAFSVDAVNKNVTVADTGIQGLMLIVR